MFAFSTLISWILLLSGGKIKKHRRSKAGLYMHIIIISSSSFLWPYSSWYFPLYLHNMQLKIDQFCITAQGDSLSQYDMIYEGKRNYIKWKDKTTQIWFFFSLEYGEETDRKSVKASTVVIWMSQCVWTMILSMWIPMWILSHNFLRDIIGIHSRRAESQPPPPPDYIKKSTGHLLLINFISFLFSCCPLQFNTAEYCTIDWIWCVG